MKNFKKKTSLKKKKRKRRSCIIQSFVLGTNDEKKIPHPRPFNPERVIFYQNEYKTESKKKRN